MAEGGLLEGAILAGKMLVRVPVGLQQSDGGRWQLDRHSSGNEFGNSAQKAAADAFSYSVASVQWLVCSGVVSGKCAVVTAQCAVVSVQWCGHWSVCSVQCAAVWSVASVQWAVVYGVASAGSTWRCRVMNRPNIENVEQAKAIFLALAISSVSPAKNNITEQDFDIPLRWKASF